MILSAQVVPAVQGRQAVRSRHERQRLGHQAEVRQPVLLPGVHSGRVSGIGPRHWTSPLKGAETVFTDSSPAFLRRLKRTTDVMFGGKQVVVCGYGEVGFYISGFI